MYAKIGVEHSKYCIITKLCIETGKVSSLWNIFT